MSDEPIPNITNSIFPTFSSYDYTTITLLWDIDFTLCNLRNNSVSNFS